MPASARALRYGCLVVLLVCAADGARVQKKPLAKTGNTGALKYVGGERVKTIFADGINSNLSSVTPERRTFAKSMSSGTPLDAQERLKRLQALENKFDEQEWQDVQRAASSLWRQPYGDVDLSVVDENLVPLYRTMWIGQVARAKRIANDMNKSEVEKLETLLRCGLLRFRLEVLIEDKGGDAGWSFENHQLWRKKAADAKAIFGGKWEGA